VQVVALRLPSLVVTLGLTARHSLGPRLVQKVAAQVVLERVEAVALLVQEV
jgi:hypothetical protein